MTRFPHRTLRFSLVLVIAALTITGCGLLSLDDDSGALNDLIQRNRMSWEEEGPDQYRYVYNRTEGQEEIEDVQVTVTGGQIDSVLVGGVRQSQPGEFLTVDGLFDEIERNFSREDRGGFQVQFNEGVSYPERYRMEPGESTAGRGVVVTDFETLGSEKTRLRLSEKLPHRDYPPFLALARSAAVTRSGSFGTKLVSAGDGSSNSPMNPISVSSSYPVSSRTTSWTC